MIFIIFLKISNYINNYLMKVFYFCNRKIQKKNNEEENVTSDYYILSMGCISYFNGLCSNVNLLF